MTTQFVTRQNVTRQNVTRQIVTRQNVAEPSETGLILNKIPIVIGIKLGITVNEMVLVFN